MELRRTIYDEQVRSEKRKKAQGNRPSKARRREI
jgi:hypothetical protein